MKSKLKNKAKSLLAIMMSLLMLIGISAPSTQVFAEGTPQAVGVKITKFEIQNTDHTTADKFYHTDTFLLMMDWDATHLGTNLHENDFFDVKLPDNMRFPSDTTARDFDLKDTDGTVVAKAHVTPGPNDEGGKIHVVFTDKVKDKYNIKGTMYLAAKFAKGKIKYDEENTFSITVNSDISGQSHTLNDGVIIQGPKPAENEYLSKWGGSVKDKPNQAKWHVRINHLKADMHNVTISDTMGDSGESFIPKSFKLQKVTFDKYGNILSVDQNVEIGNKLTFGEGNKSFELKLGNIGTQQYYLEYDTTYTPGTTLKNSAKLTSTEKTENVSFAYRSAESGGTGSGDLASKIKLIKVDAENHQKQLANAVFTVTRPDGSTFELKTGADGTIVSEVLPQGKYKVKEKTAPLGYERNNQEYTLEVTPTGGAIKTIENKPTKISVSVKKEWVGENKNAVVVHLYADDKDTGIKETLNPENQWKHTFDNLNKYKDGKEIKYTVKEDVPVGYSEKVSGNVQDGYVITNTNIEKISIPVTKQWVGRPKDQVEVKLLADGDEKETATLKKETGFSYTFTNLPKYDQNDGHEIIYTLKEVKVDGYETTISGTAKTGFTITNTITGKVSIPVTKTWVGKAGDKATVHLYADGTEVDSVTLNDGNHWQHTFTNLEKYKAGQEIKYTIKEDAIDGYKSDVTGDMASGFTVKNTNTEKISIPVMKQWVGTPKDQVEIKLLADGTEKETVTVTKAENWKHVFKNLPKYDQTDGHEIVYTIAEVKVDGYITGMSGTVKDGFTITNTITGKVSVPVTKKWIGTSVDNIIVNLYADGKKIDSHKLSKENNWQYTFKNLEQYKDGKEIKYIITEEKVDGYTTDITGNAKDGYLITNTKDTPPSKNLPKTGDSSNVGLFVGLLALSGALLTAIVVRRRKLNEK